jgi:hypothetical protein
MTKHTPGPWSAIGADVKTAGPNSHIICWTGLRSDVELEELRANARLIAAAPDMLNALLDVLDFWDDPDMSMSELKERVRYAIAKAQGEG